MPLSRGQTVAVLCGCFAVSYALLLIVTTNAHLRSLIALTPVIALSIAGFYTFATIVVAVLRFEDCTTENEALLKDVKRAREGLKRRGYIT